MSYRVIIEDLTVERGKEIYSQEFLDLPLTEVVIYLNQAAPIEVPVPVPQVEGE